MNRREHDWGASVRDVDRVVAFSDAVFAIAITLLVLQFDPPHLTTDQAATELPSRLFEQKPQYFSTVLSTIFDASTALSWDVTCFFLMCITFLQYPTELLGIFAADRAAVMFYAASVAVTGLVSSTIWWYAAKDRQLLDPAIDWRLIRGIGLRSLLVTLVFLPSIGIAYFNPEVAMYSWLVSLVLSFTLRRL